MDRHRLKLRLRDLYARLVTSTGLARLISRLGPPRLTILAGHCVAEDAVNGGLPGDMKISAGRLERILTTLRRHARPVTIAEGLEALGRGTERSLFALSMDDGYRDNLSALVPLLERTGARATVFLEARPLVERRVSWSHKYFWMLSGGQDAEAVARAYMLETTDGQVAERLRRTLEEGRDGDLAYLVKRVLKYECEAAERDRTIDALFDRAGGDERALCDRIYLDLEEARALAAAGVELGGHTVRHEVLSTLPPEEARREIAEGRRILAEALGEETGRTFAYPFGRRWDFDAGAREAVLASGYRCAVTTHSGTNTAGSEPTTLARWMIDEETPVHHLVAEVTGSFALLRRLGLDLTE